MVVVGSAKSHADSQPCLIFIWLARTTAEHALRTLGTYSASKSRRNSKRLNISRSTGRTAVLMVLPLIFLFLLERRPWLREERFSWRQLRPDPNIGDVMGQCLQPSKLVYQSNNFEYCGERHLALSMLEMGFL